MAIWVVKRACEWRNGHQGRLFNRAGTHATLEKLIKPGLGAKLNRKRTI